MLRDQLQLFVQRTLAASLEQVHTFVYVFKQSGGRIARTARYYSGFHKVLQAHLVSIRRVKVCDLFLL